MSTDLHHVSDAWIVQQYDREAREVAAELFQHGEQMMAILEDLGMTVVWR